MEGSNLIDLEIRSYEDFRFVSWIKSDDYIFPEILKIGE